LLQSVYCNQQIGPFENFHQPVENALVVLGSGLKVFLKYALRFADGLNRQLLVSHGLSTPNQSLGMYSKAKIKTNFGLQNQILFPHQAVRAFLTRGARSNAIAVLHNI
jgi:hypothetical protein